MKPSLMIVVTLVVATGSLCGAAAQQPPPTPAEEQPEVLTRGPVHEAFAEPVGLEVQAGLLVPAQPPANIVENPPANRPTGGQFVWVPGYWAWDSERNSYIWVSGCWRAAPPGMYWVPGYWARVPEGWEWVAGFWTPAAGGQQIEYLPAPPALAEVEPPYAPPSPDRIWVPPCWYWHRARYTLRPGYWVVAQPGWIWVPSHYVWTPRGYVFVAGHWDYSLDQRGVLFAPVYFPRRVYERPGFSYSASIVIDIGGLQFGLFTYPRYCHYYFGDYYDDIYIGIGIYPWFECERRHTWYDPIYQHRRWDFRRSDPQWQAHQRDDYDLRRENRDLRPPRTYHEMETRLSGLSEPQRRDFQMARPLKDVVASKTGPLKFGQVNDNARGKIAAQATDVHKFTEQRSRWESPAAGQKTAQPPAKPEAPVMKPSRNREPAKPEAPVMKPSGNREPAAPSTERKAAGAPPREVNITRGEKVNIPKPPIAGSRRGPGKGPPSRPSGR